MDARYLRSDFGPMTVRVEVGGELIGMLTRTRDGYCLRDLDGKRIDEVYGVSRPVAAGALARAAGLRKPHVRVPQAEYVEVARMTGGGSVEDFATLFDVSATTARAKLDGLVVQGELELTHTSTGERFYLPTDHTPGA